MKRILLRLRDPAGKGRQAPLKAYHAAIRAYTRKRQGVFCSCAAGNKRQTSEARRDFSFSVRYYAASAVKSGCAVRVGTYYQRGLRKPAQKRRTVGGNEQYSRILLPHISGDVNCVPVAAASARYGVMRSLRYNAVRNTETAQSIGYTADHAVTSATPRKYRSHISTDLSEAIIVSFPKRYSVFSPAFACRCDLSCSYP